MATEVAAAIAAGTLVPATVDGAKVRVNLERFTLASEAAGVYNIGAKIPKGARILSIAMMTSVTLGSTTIAVGITGTAEKYRAAATFTTTNTWTEIGAASTLGVELTAEEQLILTTAAAALPSSGTLMFKVEYADPS